MAFTEEPVVTIKNGTGDLHMEKVTRNGEVRWRICVVCSDDVRAHMPTDGMGFMEMDTEALAATAEYLVAQTAKAEGATR